MAEYNHMPRNVMELYRSTDEADFDSRPSAEPQSGARIIEFKPPQDIPAGLPAGLTERADSDDPLQQAYSAVMFAATRAQSVVESETRALKDKIIFDLGTYSEAKNRAMLDLIRATQKLEKATANNQPPADSTDPAEMMPDFVREKIKALRASLKENMDLLKLHMDAVRGITTMMTERIMDSESDGTYAADRLLL